MALAEAPRGFNPFFDNPMARFQEGLLLGEYTALDAAMAPLEIALEQQRAEEDKTTLFKHPIWTEKYAAKEPFLQENGHAVILFHGLHKTPQDMGNLALWLRTKGYTPIVAQTKPTESILKTAEDLEEPTRETIKKYEKVHLVGHSKGGFVAVVLGARIARKSPKVVENIQVVTLGTPVYEPYNSLQRWMRACVRGSIQPTELALLREELYRIPEELQAKTTRIYTQDDRVVKPASCVDFASASRHIPVRSSHSGLIHSATVYVVLSEVLLG